MHFKQGTPSAFNNHVALINRNRIFRSSVAYFLFRWKVSLQIHNLPSLDGLNDMLEEDGY